jgi:RimJ/RimL family protein N-acetyltransferase
MTPSTLLDWQPATVPPRAVLQGRFVCLEPLDPTRHGDDLWQALQGPDSDPAQWQYMPYGPFSERGAFDTWLSGHAASGDPLFFSVIDLRQQRAVGLLSLMRIAPADGCIEIGHVIFGAPMQRSPASTEAVYLLAKLALATLGYRRLEWKCDAANARSMQAAKRLGFSYEGLFRQHMVRKGRNRDTAWYSIIDREWPVLANSFERWLAADNFNAYGQQKQRLEDMRK